MYQPETTDVEPFFELSEKPIMLKPLQIRKYIHFCILKP